MGGADVVSPWTDGSTWFAVTYTETGSPVTEGSLALIAHGGAFAAVDPAPIVNGYGELPLRPIFPAAGAVTVTVTATDGSASETKDFVLTIQAEPYIGVTALGAATADDPLIIAGGATSVTYRETTSGSFLRGPYVLLSPYMDADGDCVVTDVDGLLVAATLPGADHDFTNPFYPLGAGSYGSGVLRMDLARNGYTSTRDFVYRIDSFDFYVATATGRDDIRFFGDGPFVTPLRFRIDNGLSEELGGVLAGAMVSAEDLSGNFAPFANVPLQADPIGAASLTWELVTATPTSGSARFTISNGGYTKDVLVTYDFA